MKKEEVIAKACGWKGIESYKYDSSIGVPPVSEPTLTILYKGVQPEPTNWTPRVDLPDYFHDLNAIHEAERIILTKDWRRWRVYEVNLKKVLGNFMCVEDQIWACMFAPADKRAEALFITITELDKK